MKIDDVRVLPDDELAQVIVWATQERDARTEKRKQDTIARIKEMAASVGVAVSISGQRGRPPKAGGAHKRPANDNTQGAANDNLPIGKAVKNGTR